MTERRFKMENNIEKLTLENMDQISGGKELEEMSLDELNNLIRKFERSLEFIYEIQTTNPFTEEERRANGVYKSIDATNRCLKEFKEVRKRRFGV